MKYTLNNKQIELTDEEVQEIVKQNSKVGLAIKNRFSGEVIFTSTKDTIKEAVEEAVANEANLREANLWGANLWGANLCEANLRGADLSGANLWGANLTGANLRGANLTEADLRVANLCEANLRDANLSEADLTEAKFYGKGGTTRISKSQVDDFMKALGVIIED
jgi:uncharacterized protein YjbI with pentapeptide repeats